MAPKKVPASESKVVKDCLQKLLDGGADVKNIQPGDLENIFGAEDFKKLYAHLGKQLKDMPEQKQEYEGLKGNEGSREKLRSWLCRYLMDPEGGGATGRNVTTVSHSEVDTAIEVWVSQAELGGPMYLNDSAHAALAINDLASRPHELPSLAAANIKQYGLTRKQRMLMQKKKEEAEVALDAKLTPQQYVAIKNDMSEAFERERDLAEPAKKASRTSTSKASTTAGSGMTTPESTKKTPKSQEEVDKEKALKKAKAEATKKHANYKKLLDEIAGEIATKEFLKKKMLERSVPQSMCDYVDKQVLPVENMIAQHREIVTDLAGKLTVLQDELACDNYVKNMEKDYNELTTTWTQFNKDVWSSFKGIS